MIEHTPWIGPEYEGGIDGQKIAIIGYSHHDEHPETDHSDYTCKTLADVIEGGKRPQDFVFFSRIQGYFGQESPKAFWSSVLFFNFVPGIIGDDRYASASNDQIRRGRERFNKILDEYTPQKALVFSIKGWNQLCVERNSAFGPSPFNVSDDESKPVHGVYRGHGGPVEVYSLRHPQYAIKEIMVKQVAEILHPPSARASDAA